jgi:hypothetical protein
MRVADQLIQIVGDSPSIDCGAQIGAGLLVREGDFEGGGADADFVGGHEWVRFAGRDVVFIELGAVGALEIFNVELTVDGKDAAVILGDVAVRQDDVVADHAPHNDHILIEGELRHALVAASQLNADLSVSGERAGRLGGHNRDGLICWQRLCERSR